MLLYTRSFCFESCLPREVAKVRSGLASRGNRHGGLSYSPLYMLDCLLLSDKLVVKDDLTQVAKQQLGDLLVRSLRSS